MSKLTFLVRSRSFKRFQEALAVNPLYAFCRRHTASFWICTWLAAKRIAASAGTCVSVRVCACDHVRFEKDERCGTKQALKVILPSFFSGLKDGQCKEMQVIEDV